MREVAGSTPGLEFYLLCEPICVSLRLLPPSISTKTVELFGVFHVCQIEYFQISDSETPNPLK
jgi:hypothetical protein